MLSIAAYPLAETQREPHRIEKYLLVLLIRTMSSHIVWLLKNFALPLSSVVRLNAGSGLSGKQAETAKTGPWPIGESTKPTVLAHKTDKPTLFSTSQVSLTFILIAASGIPFPVSASVTKNSISTSEAPMAATWTGFLIQK